MSKEILGSTGEDEDGKTDVKSFVLLSPIPFCTRTGNLRVGLGPGVV